MSRIHEGMFTSERGDWATPTGFFDLVAREFSFTLDAAASHGNAKVEAFYTEEDNGLTKPWRGVVWCNPPYGRQIGEWVRKGFTAAQDGATVVMLIPARTDTAYWHDYVMRAAEVRFLRGRLVFDGGGSNAPFPSALVVFRAGTHVPVITTMGRGELSKRGAS